MVSEILCGLSIRDIQYIDSHMEYFDRIALQKELLEKHNSYEKIKMYNNALLFSDAVYYATGAVHSKKNTNIFKRWKKSIVRRINKLLKIKDNRPTVWDRIVSSGKKSRRIM